MAFDDELMQGISGESFFGDVGDRYTYPF